MKRELWVVLVLGACLTSAFGMLPTLYAGDLKYPQTGPVIPGWHDGAFCRASYSVSGKTERGQWYVTESGYLAAVEEELLDRAIFWAGMGNEEEFMRFIASTDLVFPLKAGLRVYVEKFSFAGKVRIRPEGTNVSVWTIREAIRSELPVGGT